MTLYMGYTQSAYDRIQGGKRHIAEVITGFETKALCGARIVHIVSHEVTNEPVPYADHWDDAVHECQRCRAMKREKLA